MRRWAVGVVILLVSLASVAPVRANPHEARLPLHDGSVRVAELTALLGEELHIPGSAWLETRHAGEINLSGLRGATLVRALNASLGEGCRLTIDADALVLHVDPDRLPRDEDDAKHAIRVFTAEAAPVATANQRRTYGLLIPPKIDAEKPLIVLIHGLDCDKESWRPMEELLTGAGYQVGYFTYPSDGPLDESAAMLEREMAALRGTFPTLRADFITHSMGGIVARAYVEGGSYAGGVERLIMIAPPNHGSDWAKYHLLLKAQEHYHLWKHEPDWSPTWAITDGLGEAARDLKPHSHFLEELNALPRRDGVRYTIIAGCRHPATRIAGECVDAVAGIIPDRMTRWWAAGGAKIEIANLAHRIEAHEGKSDGPVTVQSTKLEGVNDYVLLDADHVTLYYPHDGLEPEAWPIIRDRLARD